MQKIKQEIQEIVQNNTTNATKLQAICDLLKKKKEHYDWVGFYFKNGNKNELKLAQFAGNQRNIPLFRLEKAFADK